jgi:hypothetical protein
MLARELTQCLLSGRACGPPLGVALLFLLTFLVLGGAFWAFRVRRDDRAQALRRALLDAGIAVCVLFLLISTLAPVPTDSSSSVNVIPFAQLSNSLGHGGTDLRNALFDVIANFAVFVPLGFLVGLRFGVPSLPAWAGAIVALVIAIELLQALALGRSGDVTDVITNAGGGITGFVTGRLLRGRTATVHAGGPA